MFEVDVLEAWWFSWLSLFNNRTWLNNRKAVACSDKLVLKSVKVGYELTVKIS